LAYLLEHEEQSMTIGDLFRQLEGETGNLTFSELLWQHPTTSLTLCKTPWPIFVIQDLNFELISTLSLRFSTAFPQFNGCEI
jgi:hypothetical protein